MSKRVKIELFFLVLTILSFGFFVPENLAQTQSRDVIAIRVISNPKNYSAATWYVMRGFKGSPQVLTVDDYEAVRDGRSVYVNVANVQGGNMYTNIYLISFNQEAENVTVDIFGEMLSRWKFNSNFPDEGACSLTASQACLASKDCPEKEYCTSEKARIVRDTRRLSDLSDIRILLEKYSEKNGNYPILKSGSYVAHTSVSTWPSWQKLLAQHLGQFLPIDPLNIMGDCGNARFDRLTCWDNQEQDFADANPGTTEIDLPAGSYAYIYIVSPDGSSYTLNGQLEGGYGALPPGGGGGGGGGGSTANIPPSFTGSVLNGKTGEEFSGYIRVSDDNASDALVVTINTSGTAWNGWSAAPVIRDVPGVSNQRQVHAVSAGAAGNYPFTATVSDQRGGVITQSFIALIVNDPPVIDAFDVDYYASTTKPLDVTFQVRDALSNYPLTYSLAPDGNYGLNYSTFNLSGQVYLLNINGVFNPLTEVIYPPARDYGFVVTASDRFGATGVKNFTISVLNNRPVINLPLACNPNVRVGTLYPPCTVTARDPEGNAISRFNFASLPAGITGSAAGIITGTPDYAAFGTHNISISAVDEYGAISSDARYTLHINTYCGDGVKQGAQVSPNRNMENKGGPSNDGREDCDGTDGIAASADLSSPTRMYACSGACPENGNCLGTCQFITGINGGWCGDSVPQDGTGTINLEQCDDGTSDARGVCDVININGRGKCTWTFCGDGTTQNSPTNGVRFYGSAAGTGFAEDCDDGRNGVNTDECTDDCTSTYCGDSRTQNPNGRRTLGLTGVGDEQCDDGTANNNIARRCDADCTFTFCGDGYVQTQNGAGTGGSSGTGNETCEDDGDCSRGTFCEDCACGCRDCVFDQLEDFDFCCMP